GSGERPESRIEMAVHASKVVAGIALLRIARGLADMLCGIDDQGMAVADDIVLGARRKVGDVARVPIGRPSPKEITRTESSGQRHDERDADHPITILHGLFTPLMGDARAAKS